MTKFLYLHLKFVETKNVFLSLVFGHLPVRYVECGLNYKVPPQVFLSAKNILFVGNLIIPKFQDRLFFQFPIF